LDEGIKWLEGSDWIWEKVEAQYKAKDGSLVDIVGLVFAKKHRLEVLAKCGLYIICPFFSLYYMQIFF
jgi:hypothetical protein